MFEYCWKLNAIGEEIFSSKSYQKTGIIKPYDFKPDPFAWGDNVFFTVAIMHMSCLFVTIFAK